MSLLSPPIVNGPYGRGGKAFATRTGREKQGTWTLITITCARIALTARTASVALIARIAGAAAGIAGAAARNAEAAEREWQKARLIKLLRQSPAT